MDPDSDKSGDKKSPDIEKSKQRVGEGEKCKENTKISKLICEPNTTSGPTMEKREINGSGTVIQRPDPGKCGFYVQRKKRFCRMVVKPGAQYCGEHTPLPVTESEIGAKPMSELRVPCPYDPKHTCFASKMDKHLKICNSKPPLILPEYIVPGINSGNPRCAGPIKFNRLSIAEASDEKLINIIGQLMATYKKFVDGNIMMEHLEHSAMEDELNKLEYGPSVLKHLFQNSSLLGQLDKSGLLENGNTFVEFGSGRGQLTYWLTKALPDPSTCQFILVDKASHRHKFDNRLRESEDIELVRLRADIQDLCLAGLSPYLTDQKESVVGISKHLCGAATDLAIRCMTQTLNNTCSDLVGILIALCCHHRCDWSPYVGKDFLLEQGFTEDDFPLLSSITSWYTCGSGKPRSRGGQAGAVDLQHQDSPSHELDLPVLEEADVSSLPQQVDAPDVPSNRDRYARLQLDQATREEIGRQCKRVLDYGRLKYLQSTTDLDVKLKYYVDPFISLENALIVCTKPLTSG